MSKAPHNGADHPAVIIEIGNTNTTVATWQEGQVRSPLRVATKDDAGFQEAFDAHLKSVPSGRPGATVVASVVPKALERVSKQIEERTHKAPLIIGDTIPLPMDVGVEDKKAIGVDRVCEAFAAYEKIQAACTIIALGTAITVDLVDDDGVLLGGAILPGLRMQLLAMHEHTAQLPAVEPGFPAQAFGRNTKEAMQTGVCRGAVGAVRNIVEGYASHLGRWPQVVATGGDLELLQPHLDFVDSFVANLALRGVGLCYSKHLAEKGV